MMARNKTIENDNDVTHYVDAIVDIQRRKDCADIIALITKQTNLPPKMWGTGIVGFGSYHYKYESGREGDAPLVALAARANAIVLYLPAGFDNREELLKKFGKYKEGKGCIYVQKLAEVNTEILGKMISNSVMHREKTCFINVYIQELLFVSIIAFCS